MSSPTPKSPFASITAADLDKVSGGASRVSSRAGGSNDQLTAMLLQITDSIKGLAGQQQGSDPMQMMMMMMMMGGGFGGGGGGGAPAAAAAPTAPQPPVINVTVKRGW